MIISAFYSGIRGGRMFADALIEFLEARKVPCLARPQAIELRWRLMRQWGHPRWMLVCKLEVCGAACCHCCYTVSRRVVPG